jgi:predicted dehydrogenase
MAAPAGESSEESACTWPDSHCEIVLDLVASGGVRGIPCEKPLALNMGDARRMVDACERGG